ncbi:MAG: hypothetical protein ABIS50_17485 [Luteolibacter sp.]|uniref:hypothetical protein n=1 Tax=Luteolibacter sp. TaxID=1962973 RepID=UPI00326309FA
MKLPVASCLLAIALCLPLFGQRATDFTAAMEKAKSSKANIVVFVHGSDWNRPGETVAKIWNDPRFLSGIGTGVLLVNIDRKESPSSSDEALAKLNAKGDPEVRSIPAVAVYDNEGRFVGSFSGLAEIEAAGGLLPATRRLLATCRQRDEFWKTADGASGMIKAGRLGQGLDSMDIGLGPKGLYKPVLEEMRKADPEDQSGFIGKYTFSSEKLVDLALDKAEKKDFAAADTELKKWDSNPRLSPKQRQQLQGARFALYQRWPERKRDLKAVLEAMRDIDPKSELGMAAITYLRMLSEQRKKGDPPA